MQSAATINDVLNNITSELHSKFGIISSPDKIPFTLNYKPTEHPQDAMLA
jgi:hypothetical protein